MKFSIKSDYACRAVQALALHYPNPEPLRVEEIAARETIPANYLIQILIELKSKGLIQSRRGKSGGYLLAKTPRAISMGDVLRAVNGAIVDVSALAEGGCPPELQRAWQRIKTAAEGVADDLDFERLASEAHTRAEMYYI
jgi:Rrf2 family cysteine metabolism transcriptional repressor